MDMVIQIIGDGLVLGAFYSLIALGYTMVYGIIRLLNFAHGDFYMFGAFIGYAGLSIVMGDSGIGLLAIGLVFLLAVLIVGLVGMGVERIAYRPLLDAPRISLLITAIGVGFSLQYGTMMIWSPNHLTFPITLPTTGFDILGVNITYAQLGIIGMAALLMIGLDRFVHGTIYGKAMQAIAMDQTATQLMGINVHRIVSITFFIGTSLAAVAGLMAAVYYGTINFFMGFIMGLKAFTAAVLGGIGNIQGAMLGGIMLGILETAGTMFIGSAWKDIIAFSILIIFLVFKPTGILGEKVTERM